jgi:hypothetical protein
MQIAALTSAFGLTGAATAQNTEGTTSSGDRGSILNSGMDTPSAGAIVTPDDKALGMGQEKERTGDANENSSSSNDDELNVNPEPLNDDESSVNPGPSNDDESSVNPGSVQH